MANYNSVASLVSNINNATKIVDNVEYDDGSKSDTSETPLSFFNYNVSTFYCNGNSYVAYSNSDSESYSFRVNRRDARMQNLWRETGKIRSANFVRYRWDGYSRYSSSSEQCHYTFDVVFTDADVIFLHIVKAATSYWDGKTSFRYSGTDYGTINNSDGVIGVSEFDYTFYPTTAGDPTTVISTAGLLENLIVFDTAYLVKDYTSGKIYTYVNGVPMEIQGNLTEQIFQDYGLLSFPQNLPDNFQVIKWSNDAIGSTIEVVGKTSVPQNERSVVFHINSLPFSNYINTTVDTDGTVYYSSDGNTYSETDNLASHNDYYVKVVMGTYINDLIVNGY